MHNDVCMPQLLLHVMEKDCMVYIVILEVFFFSKFCMWCIVTLCFPASPFGVRMDRYMMTRVKCFNDHWILRHITFDSVVAKNQFTNQKLHRLST